MTLSSGITPDASVSCIKQGCSLADNPVVSRGDLIRLSEIMCGGSLALSLYAFLSYGWLLGLCVLLGVPASLYARSVFRRMPSR